MDWTSELRGVKEELEPLRQERERQAIVEEAERQDRLAEVKKFFDSLKIEEMLGEMNRVLLAGQGNLEVYTPWDTEESPAGEEEEMAEEDEDGDYEESDSVSAVLGWDEGGPLEIAVDVGPGSDGYYLQVNGVDIRLEEDAIQQALLRAFRDELGL